MKTLKNQFLFDLAEIFEAEDRVAKALPKMIKADTSAELKEAILSHARDTEGQVRKVEQLFECFGHSATGNPEGTTGKYGPEADDGIVEPCASSPADEDALLSALKLVEQGDRPINGCPREWEIASYGCLKEWTNQQGSSEGADLLEQILAEEEMARPSDHKKAI